MSIVQLEKIIKGRSDHSTHLLRFLEQSADRTERGPRPWARVQHFPAQTQIAHEGGVVPCCFGVVDGWLALTKMLADGERQMIDVCLPNDVLAASSGDSRSSHYGIEALTEVTLFSMTGAEWELVKQGAPRVRLLGDHLVALTAARRAERMLRLGRGSAAMRLAYALIELHVRLDTAGHKSINVFHIPMTQQQLGDFTGLSSVHVCRTLRRFIRSGLIGTSDHIDITIRDIDGLCAVAGVDLERLRAEIAPPVF
jgi:CRP/FNR family transcriptional regulator, anaerobic regulatory protein